MFPIFLRSFVKKKKKIWGFKATLPCHPTTSPLPLVVKNEKCNDGNEWQRLEGGDQNECASLFFVTLDRSGFALYKLQSRYFLSCLASLMWLRFLQPVAGGSARWRSLLQGGTVSALLVLDKTTHRRMLSAQRFDRWDAPKAIQLDSTAAGSGAKICSMSTRLHPAMRTPKTFLLWF